MRRRTATAALALLALAGCTNGGDPKKPKDPPGNDAVPIAIDACPTPEELLPEEKRPTSGNRLPDVTLPCLGHPGTVSMRALGGKPTVVNLWASWCFPCRTEMPEFQKVHVQMRGRVRFLGVDTKDFEKDARAAIQRAAISYPNVFDKDERVRRGVNARTLPATLLVGPDGRIRNVHVGELTAAELRAQITKHLGVT